MFNGLISFAAGSYLIHSAKSFEQNSVALQLRVVKVEKKKSDDDFVYMTRFEALRDDGAKIRYSGNKWSSPKQHEEGELVDGRVNWKTGEMRSVRMINSDIDFGKLTIYIGSIPVLLGVLLLSRRRIFAFFRSGNPD